MTRYDYRFARVIGRDDEFERVIDIDGPTDEMGVQAYPDMFKLEHSGWCDLVEFMPVDEALK